jgi:hypothetical protein
MPDRPSSRLFLAVAMPHATAANHRLLVLPTFESCLFLQVMLAVACLLSPWPRSTEGIVAQSMPYFRSLLPCNACRLAALCFASPTIPHLPSVLAGQQVVRRCAGPGTLVPRARCEHVMNMGRCGHAHVRDLVTRTSHEPLSPLFAPALLQSAYPLSPYLALCCEACSAPCARN